VAKTGSWNYGDQRIQRVEQTFPEQTVQPIGIDTIPQVITTQQQVITTQPQAPLISTQQHLNQPGTTNVFQQEPVSRVINFVPTAETEAQRQQNFIESLPATQGLTNQQPFYTGAQQLQQPMAQGSTQGLTNQQPFYTGAQQLQQPMAQGSQMQTPMTTMTTGFPSGSQMNQLGGSLEQLNVGPGLSYMQQQQGMTSDPNINMPYRTDYIPGNKGPAFQTGATGGYNPLTSVTGTTLGQPNMSSGTGITQPLTGTNTGSSSGQTIFPSGQGMSNFGPRVSPTNMSGQPQGTTLIKTVEQDIAAKFNQPNQPRHL
jgi:hypothetical protein